MLIYNNKKEFIGIDEHDLNTLGFSTLSELQNEVADFADLFMKEPGFIHNFTHVNWIDFIECADPLEGSKVLINVNSRNFKCNLTVTTAFLTEDPSSKAYLVHLNNMAELTEDQKNYISVELLEKTTPEPKVVTPKKEVIENIDTPESTSIAKEVTQEKVTPKIRPADNLKQEIKIEKVPEEIVIDDSEEFDNGYIYDPLVASSELGLPVELIEEFIEDFIAQAIEFKDDLYNSLHNGDKESLKALSHKLKGVAANLRVEDAFESLTIINTSDSSNEIQKHLDILYKIISKLSNKNTDTTETAIDNKEENQIQENDNFATDIQIEDNDVPEKIHMPELADDDFLTPTVEDGSQELENIEMLDDDIFNSKDINSSTQSKENIEPEIEDIEDFELEFKTELPDLVSEATSTVFNKELVASEIGLDKETFNELLEDYLVEANSISATISKAIEEDDKETWVQQAHKLKGMSENMRILSFKDELDSLIQTSEGSIAKEANEKILESIKQISGMEE